MRVNKVYYLKKYHSPLITNEKPNTRLIVKIESDVIMGVWLDDNGKEYGSMHCLKDQFNKLFQTKPIK